MGIFLFLAVIITVYVISFKDNFTKEHIDKVAPVLILILVVSVALIVLASLLKN